MSVREIVPGLHLLALGISNAYLWQDEDGVTLIDTGPAGSGPAITSALSDLGLRREDVRRVVLTHFHDDHAGSAAEVRRWAGAEVVAGAGDAPFVRGARPGPGAVLTPAEEDLFARVSAGLPPAPACPVDRATLDGDDVLPGGGMVVVAVPGHTPGSVAVHLPAHGVLVTGDTVAESQGTVLLGPFNVDRETAWRSLQRLAALEPDVACFGHGEPVVGGAAAALRDASDPLG
jgi:glyoxylase-like metal-dependent hydrolase (beta-lactamase superfamily II)